MPRTAGTPPSASGTPLAGACPISQSDDVITYFQYSLFFLLRRSFKKILLRIFLATYSSFFKLFHAHDRPQSSGGISLSWQEEGRNPAISIWYATCRCLRPHTGLGSRVQGSGFRVQGSGFRVQGSGCLPHQSISQRVCG